MAQNANGFHKIVQNFYGKLGKRMQLTILFWDSLKICKVEHFLLIPVAFSIKIWFLDCFIVLVDNLKKSETGQM